VCPHNASVQEYSPSRASPPSRSCSACRVLAEKAARLLQGAAKLRRGSRAGKTILGPIKPQYSPRVADAARPTIPLARDGASLGGCLDRGWATPKVLKPVARGVHPRAVGPRRTARDLGLLSERDSKCRCRRSYPRRALCGIRRAGESPGDGPLPKRSRRGAATLLARS
jgi:hypothetical protein